MSKGSNDATSTRTFALRADDLNASKLDVYMHDIPVGTLASLPNGSTAFEYSNDWLTSGFSISPLSLPLEKRVFIANQRELDGLFGIFDDSLPDGWGRLLVDRFLREQGIDPLGVSPLGRLAIVGKSGMGALEYSPAFDFSNPGVHDDFDGLAAECASLLESEAVDDLDELFALGGSSGGARPKVLTAIDGEDWIVKFPSSIDSSDIGAQEFAIANAASAAGIEMPEVQLIPSSRCSGYFATKRFDRIGKESSQGVTKIHMASAAALLETSHRIPNLDYSDLMKLTLMVTHDMSQVEAMFRLMAFNVFIGNRDDHSKNFSFLKSIGPDSAWILSPGYDLTSNPGMNGEHFTTVNGKGKGITVLDMVEVGVHAGIREAKARVIIDDVSDVVRSELECAIGLPSISYR